MLAVNSYPQDDVNACRAEFAAQAAAYRDLIAAASKASTTSLVRLEAALAAFEPRYFNNLLVALDARFVHRLRDTELKDGNALNEVRMLVAALMNHGGVMTADRTISYDAAGSVLGIDIGDRIALNGEDFEAIAAAFLDEIEKKYG